MFALSKINKSANKKNRLLTYLFIIVIHTQYAFVKSNQKLAKNVVVVASNNDNTFKIEPLNHSVAEMGEGPHWDSSTQSLYFVDIHTARLFRYDYNEDKTYETKIENEKHASFIIPIDGKQNHFAVGLGRRVGDIEWDGKSAESKVVSILFEVESNDEKFENNRFNDAKADPMGRFYGGTMPIDVDPDIFKTKNCGNLYSYDTSSKTPILLKDNLTIPNGLTWNTQTNKFYFIDSVDLDIKEYDYDSKTGAISNPKTVGDLHEKAKTEKPNFVADGMTIDSSGNLYVATFNGGKIFKVNPTNAHIEMEIPLPAEQITSLAFGGPNFDIVFVTTAAAGSKPSPAGQTLKLTGLGIKGLEMYKLKI